MVGVNATSIVLEWVLGSTQGDISGKIGQILWLIRLYFVVPLLRICLYFCLFLSLLLSLEWIHLMIVSVIVKLFRKKADKRYKFEEIKDDLEGGSEAFPLVLVQIPIANEVEVYKLSIGAACKLSWPTDRLIIQVLDDSSDQAAKNMIEKETSRWANEGINITYEARDHREGYKAGALKQGMEQDYVKQCEYVAIFDVDFQPDPDFLRRSIPFLMHNPQLGLVQTRWRFVNADACLLTRLQEMSLDFHFRFEQEVGSSGYGFFGFNGSGGIWRINAMNDAGGWDWRTTAEDMDLSVRAALKGWEFLYLGDIQVKSELPSSIKAHRSQQHRWFCAPANLFRTTLVPIAVNKKVSLKKKLYMLLSFFLVRKVVGHVFVLLFYCVVLPLTILFPEVVIRKDGAIIAPCIIAAVNTVVGTPRSLYLILHWILFETAMSYRRTKSIFVGLFRWKSVNEWVVTEKLGDSLNNKTNIESADPKHRERAKALEDRILLPELAIAVFILACGCYGFFFGKEYYYYVYMLLQVIFLTLMGFSCFGLKNTASLSSHT
ncbi:glucomannan 4-beta-mannosyltransferase 2-like [Dorcoceras hygrometricum]|uniref:glucomannan 4-beta-mannosyltransferase n=1 Tax=Dorcoceras hygrometricum TaxID=472368 RepID=A0A2Z7D3E4_9LAMI|nr:glucomannan 4-beta-mannosyltransferase 2-like [Dorcoceras hygrometricum]